MTLVELKDLALHRRASLQPAPWVQGPEARSLGTCNVSLRKEPVAAGEQWCVSVRKMVQGHEWTELCDPHSYAKVVTRAPQDGTNTSEDSVRNGD